uniref:RING-type domain-containing protein n=3 Tax=Setaria italica TaxID=4555 RepID=K3ZL57_SETIT
REIGEIEAQGGGESPPLFDQATPPPLYAPASVSSLTRGDAAAASISNKRGRVAASSKAIQGLREVTAPPTDGSDDCCAICLQDLDYSDKAHPVPLRAMPCSHTFHEHCIFEWLRRNAVCPLCRHQLPTEDDHEQEQEQGMRRIRTRFVYSDEEGQDYGFWYYTAQPFSRDDEEEEEEEVVVSMAALREFYAGWLNMGRNAAASAEDHSIRSQS